MLRQMPPQSFFMLHPLLLQSSRMRSQKPLHC
jgi:hypothetical protein